MKNPQQSCDCAGFFMSEGQASLAGPCAFVFRASGVDFLPAVEQEVAV